MASSLQSLFLFFSLICPIAFSQAHKSHFPITKDFSTLQYVTTIHYGTPLLPIKLVVDLSRPFLWLDSASVSASSSSRPIQCCFIQCSTVKAHDCGAEGSRTCGLSLENPITRVTARGNLVEDIIVVQSEDRSEAGSIAAAHQDFLFYSAPAFLSKGLASGAKGMIGFGRGRISLPTQLAITYGLDRKFAVCLSSSGGVIFSGEMPADVSKALIYTPLTTNQADPSGEYRVNVKSIKINGKRLSLNPIRGTEISTIVPYTTMESSIYEKFTKAYINMAASMNMTRVGSVAPFGVCFSSRGIGSTPVGPAVPTIDLVLQSEMVKWRICGWNSMVRVNDGVMCLGFFDGGLSLKSSIAIGGYQLEETLLEFDLSRSMLGFSSSLLARQTTCSNFKFYSLHKGSL